MILTMLQASIKRALKNCVFQFEGVWAQTNSDTITLLRRPPVKLRPASPQDRLASVGLSCCCKKWRLLKLWSWAKKCEQAAPCIAISPPKRFAMRIFFLQCICNPNLSVLASWYGMINASFTPQIMIMIIMKPWWSPLVCPSCVMATSSSAQCSVVEDFLTNPYQVLSHTYHTNPYQVLSYHHHWLWHVCANDCEDGDGDYDDGEYDDSDYNDGDYDDNDESVTTCVLLLMVRDRVNLNLMATMLCSAKKMT